MSDITENLAPAENLVPAEKLSILAVMQNQWVRDPNRLREIYQRNPDKRNYFIRAFLFMGCLSGRRLRSALGEDLCRRIVWEEASAEIGGHSQSNFGADIDHLNEAVRLHAPDLVICFGKIAESGVRALGLKIPIIFAPHPAARNNPLAELRTLPQRIEHIQSGRQPIMKFLSEKLNFCLKLIESCGQEAYGLKLVEASNNKLLRGGIYVMLGRLEKAGYISSRVQQRQTKRSGIPLRIYVLTDLGRKYLEALRAFEAISNGGEVKKTNV